MTTARAIPYRLPRVTAGPEFATPPARLVVLMSLLALTTLSWRRGVYYSGGLDPVVALKGALNLAALWLAMWSAARAPLRYRPGRAGGLLVGGWLVVSQIGAWTTRTTLMPSTVLAGRILILTVTVYYVLRAFPFTQVYRSFIWAMTTVLVIAVGSGLALGATSRGRLAGGLPPLNPNEITGLCGIVAITLAWRGIAGRSGRWDLLSVIALFAVIWLTGSRTGLLTLVLAFLVVLLQARRMPAGVFLVLCAGVPAMFYLVFGTSKLWDFLNRGGSVNVDSLNNRTVAWRAAVHLHHGWDVWFGSGLSMVKIPVQAQYWSHQVLDSSWLSALVQGGIVGFVLLALWTLVAAGKSLRSARGYRVLASGLLIFIVSRSILESGLIGATPDFLLFTMLTMRQRAPRSEGPLPDRSRLGLSRRQPLLVERVEHA